MQPQANPFLPLKPKELYRAICAQEPSLPVFLQCWWLDAVCDGWNVVIAIKGDAVVGVWPYSLQQRYSVRMMRNPRLTPYLGPHIFCPPDVKASKRDSFEHDAVLQLLEQLPDNDVWLLAIQPGMHQAGLFKHEDLTLSVQQTFLLDLTQDEETIFQNFKEPLRRNLKGGADDYTITDEPGRLADLYSFQEKTFFRKRVAQSYDLEQMQQLMDACRKHKSAALWTACNATGEVQALLWNVWDSETSYYYMGAKNPATPDYRAVSALLWHAIKEAKAHGCKTFDFEGSMDEGVERFFRSFGARRELYMVLQKDDHWLWRLSKRFRK